MALTYYDNPFLWSFQTFFFFSTFITISSFFFFLNQYAGIRNGMIIIALASKY